MATAREMHSSRLSAAELNQRITLQARITTQDERGQEANARTPGTTVWARVRPTSGREYVAANAVQSQNNVTFTTRYMKSLFTALPVDYVLDPTYFAADYLAPGAVTAQLTGELRIIWKNQPYQVIEPPTDIEGDGDALEFVCSGGRPGVAIVVPLSTSYAVDPTYFLQDYLAAS